MNRSVAMKALAACTSITMMMLLVTPARAVTVDLCAGAATVTMPGGAVITVWGFAPGGATDGSCTGTVTLPGPMLTVPPGDPQLRINLANTLDEPVSIVVRAQIAGSTPVMFTDSQGRTRVRSLAAQTPPGEARTYEWNGFRPGTYVYHSGTHPQVQVQMGLYGSVRKNFLADQAYDGIAFDNEVVLFYSEIDPALHAAVANGTYGTDAMPSTINYAPKYFLVNGAPFSSTAGLPPLDAGGSGERTLVRFLNMGLQSHTLVMQGMHASLVAEDGSPYPYAREQYSVFLPAGKTLDAIVVPPAEGTYAVFDRELNLTNAAAAPGGMLSYLAVGPGGGPAAPTLFFSTLGNYAVPGVSSPYDDADIYSWNGTTYARVFDGSAAGLPASADIDAFQLVDADTVYVSFDANLGVTVPGIGLVQDEDIVRYDAGAWTLVFDGSAMGLGASTGGDVDSVQILGSNELLVSFVGNRAGTGLPLAHADEDVLLCRHSGATPIVSCTWSLYFDGSDVGLAQAGENVDGASIDPTTGVLYLTTTGNCAVAGLAGQGRDVIRCNGVTTGAASACTSFSLFFDGSANGLSETVNSSLVDAIDLH